jgi:CHAT domain-containing protein
VKLKIQQSLFRGVDLLVFSACSTGVGTASKRGREIDGIGYIGETQGAKTVMATLWPVADDSTSLLMKEFYKRREMGLTKIEALRQSQIEILNGSIKPTKSHLARSEQTPLRYEVDQEKPYAHPYYWAPFILIGNYR